MKHFYFTIGFFRMVPGLQNEPDSIHEKREKSDFIHVETATKEADEGDF
jgi:hypothetical protein